MTSSQRPRGQTAAGTFPACLFPVQSLEHQLLSPSPPSTSWPLKQTLDPLRQNPDAAAPPSGHWWDCFSDPLVFYDATITAPLSLLSTCFWEQIPSPDPGRVLNRSLGQTGDQQNQQV